MKRDLRGERLGQISTNKFGTKMEIIAYENSDYITVEFPGKHRKDSSYKSFKERSIINPYDKCIYGIGFNGEGDSKIKINGKITSCYNSWKGMLERCYNEERRYVHPTYKGCTVCTEWHNYQVYSLWYEEHYYKVEGQRMEVDKDIIKKGNKIYSPENCVIIPQKINSLFTRTDALRGDCPIGVYYRKDCNKYIAQCMNGTNSQKYLGRYDTPEEAFYAYKTYKEYYIKQVAEKYKDIIPIELYNALYRYIVEITD